ncbi:hypothetical protein A3A79_04985 [Candidatus Gottesmanbacteria bacterium RIFCSPLOWO2_01_FULL_43_11b]|uniref:Glycosyl transferase family 1 domain-containing protein n=1 Tax=Candidatus Gottesmanbacteria bacterium RIFCSPLOWO2_01_FULL_43_11b TaxID=1798392 RepID=A0A1F6AIF6_9BACT|nr:MAG: hypothetical protein A3A79_04985 [Candidatus Gottesmanbacteria bacterium RIFCSPLOWO2_01_FULL_43_11b]
MIRQYKTIIYVNFSPYENAGRILDYLRTKFKTILLFSFNFHHLGAVHKPGTLSIYKNGKLIKTYALLDLPIRTTPSTVFLLIPIRSFLNLLQIWYYVIRLKNQYGPYDIYFTVNAFTAWVGNLLKKYRFVKKTIFWVWDYYPPSHPNKIVSLVRWNYWQFDKKASQESDTVAFLHLKLQELRMKINALPKHDTLVVPIGTSVNPLRKSKRDLTAPIIGFLGVLKKTQGLDIFFDNAQRIHELFPNLTCEIIGSGPDEQYFREKAGKSQVPVKFYGYIPDYQKVKNIQKQWHIGIAPYVPEESNVSYYTDNSKIKDYLSLGIPVIVTPISLAGEIRRSRAGIVFNYTRKQEFVRAIGTILSRYNSYQINAKNLADRYDYKKIYVRLFE